MKNTNITINLNQTPAFQFTNTTQSELSEFNTSQMACMQVLELLTTLQAMERKNITVEVRYDV